MTFSNLVAYVIIVTAAAAVNSTPASRTEPAVGASVWASGSHVWNGNIGTLMAKPTKKPRKIQY